MTGDSHHGSDSERMMWTQLGMTWSQLWLTIVTAAGVYAVILERNGGFSVVGREQRLDADVFAEVAGRDVLSLTGGSS